MNIHDKFNSTNFDKTFSLLNKFDSFKIVDGNITFFKKENCCICNCSLEGVNPITFIYSNKPYTFFTVDDLLTSKCIKQFKYSKTLEQIEPIEKTGQYGCYDCKSKIDN